MKLLAVCDTCWRIFNTVSSFSFKVPCQFVPLPQMGTPGLIHSEVYTGYTTKDLEAPNYLIGPQGTVE